MYIYMCLILFVKIYSIYFNENILNRDDLMKFSKISSFLIYSSKTDINLIISDKTKFYKNKSKMFLVSQMASDPIGYITLGSHLAIN